MKLNMLLLLLLVVCCHLYADEFEAIRVRKLVEQEITNKLPRAAEKYILPVSAGFHQKSTELCWVFATLNMLESNYLYKNPHSNIQLSREFMQYLTWKDRYIRYIQGIREFLSDRGNAIDALKLIEEHGLLTVSAYPAPLQKFSSIKYQVDREPNINAKMNLVDKKLDGFYGKPGVIAQLDGETYNRKQLAYKILGSFLWQTYGVKDQKLGLADHPDPDARKESFALYVTRQQLPAKIKKSLQNGHAMTIGLGGHVVMLYGAEYDATGKAITYYIKDSYPNYFYQATPQKIEGKTWGITTVKQN